MKPDDIPEDVWEAASQLWGDEARVGIARSVMAERERCLRVIAEQKRAFMSPEYAYPQPIGSLSEQFACDQIAAAIRQPREGNVG